MNSNDKQAVSSSVIWMSMYFGLSIGISFLVQFPVSIVVIILIVFLISFIRRTLMMKKMGININKLGIFNPASSKSSESNFVRYFCMSCGHQHKEIACPKCGSKMKRIG